MRARVRRTRGSRLSSPLSLARTVTSLFLAKSIRPSSHPQKPSLLLTLKQPSPPPSNEIPNPKSEIESSQGPESQKTFGVDDIIEKYGVVKGSYEETRLPKIQQRSPRSARTSPVSR